MDREGIYWQRCDGGQNYSDLDAILVAAGDRLLENIHRHLDLATGLAQIIGDPPLEENASRNHDLADDSCAGEWPMGIRAPGSANHANSAESRYLAGPGKALYRYIASLINQQAYASAKVKELKGAIERAETRSRGRNDSHRGGDGPWPLRLLIAVAVATAAATVYVALEALAVGQSLASGFALLTALVGAGMACILADRRLNWLPVPKTARILEGFLVAVVTVLRYQSLRTQRGSLTAAGGATFSALISASTLAGIEIIVVQTRTFAMFLSTLQLSWTRWRAEVSIARLARIEAKVQSAADELEQHFIVFLLETDGIPLSAARAEARSARCLISIRGINATPAPAASPEFSAADRSAVVIAGKMSTVDQSSSELSTDRRRVFMKALAAATGTFAMVVTGLTVLHAQPSANLADAAEFGQSFAVRQRANEITTTQKIVMFPLSRYRLSLSAKVSLAKWVSSMANLSPSHITIKGYADTAKATAENQNLALMRATSVASFLVAHGVSASTLSVISPDPVATQPLRVVVVVADGSSP